MKSIEIIHLRLAGNPPETLIEQIRSSIAAAGRSVDVALYRDAAVRNDFALHIRSDGKESRESDLGLRIAAALREHGLVDHTVWIEEGGG